MYIFEYHFIIFNISQIFKIINLFSKDDLKYFHSVQEEFIELSKNTFIKQYNRGNEFLSLMEHLFK